MDRVDGLLCFCGIVRSEEERDSFENFVQSGRAENPNAFAEPTTIDRTKLRDVDHAGKQESSLTSTEATVPRHRRKPKIGRYRGDDEMAPVHLSLADHQRSSVQSVPTASNSLAE